MNTRIISILVALTCAMHASDTWTATGNLITARSDHSAALLNNGKVLVVGGDELIPYFEWDPNLSEWVYFGATSSPLSSTELFDPSTGTFSPSGSMSVKRSQCGATILADGRILASGGRSSGFPPTLCEIYDPSTGSWSGAGNLNTARYAHTATKLQDGRVLVTGGRGTTSFLASCEVYDPATNAWTPTGNLNTSRYNHIATLLSDGTVLVTGGYNGSVLSSCELYDASTGIWINTANLSKVRTNHSALTLADGKVLVIGCESGESAPDVFDPATHTWSNIAAPPPVFAGSGVATRLSDGSVLYVSDYAAKSQRYRPLSDTWESTVNMITGRESRYTATRLQDGKVLVVGGLLTEYDYYDSSYGITYDRLYSTNLVEIHDPEISSSPFQEASALAGLTGNDALPNAIPFHEVVPNLLKYAFGLNLGGPDARRMAPGGTVGLPTA